MKRIFKSFSAVVLLIGIYLHREVLFGIYMSDDPVRFYHFSEV